MNSTIAWRGRGDEHVGPEVEGRLSSKRKGTGAQRKGRVREVDDKKQKVREIGKAVHDLEVEGQAGGNGEG